MRVNVLDGETFAVLNIRHTDEIAEDYAMSDLEADLMEEELRKTGRYWVNSAVYLTRAA